MKFPDFVHAVKPEPHWAIPQGQSAHDTFWDYVSLQPETLHNVMWAMSDRGIPRSYRTMEGFGIHTFRLINAEGKATFVRFHWKPVAGKASLVWDEAQKLTGRDPDFIAATCGRPSKPGTTRNLSLACSSSPRRTSLILTSICSIPPS